MGRKPRIETLIGNCNHFLSLRNFTASRKFAMAALKSDPGSPEAAQALAICDVLFAADLRFPNNRLDYYSILQVRPHDFECKRSVFVQFKKLLRLLNPSKNKFPFCREAFDLICDAWSILSKPEKKQKYDIEIETSAANAKSPVNTETENHIGNNSNGGEKDEEKQKEGIPTGEKHNFVQEKGKFESSEELKQKKETFWTVCPYCYCLHEYEKEFRECSLKCPNCKRGFHAVDVVPLPASLVADGRKEYYGAIGFFKYGYPWDGLFGPKKENSDHSDSRMDNVVALSDDNRGDNYDDKTKHKVETGETGGGVGERKTNTEHGEMAVEFGEEKEETLRAEGEGIKKNFYPGLVNGRLNGKRVISVAWNTKKGMKKFRMTESVC